MQYEDLRTVTVLHWERILELEAIAQGLRDELAEMTRLKEGLEVKLADKERQYEELTENYEALTKELADEQEAHELQC